MPLLPHLQFIKRPVLFVFISLMSSFPWTAQARVNSLGIGGVVGQPHGLSLQIPAHSSTAFNASLYYDIRTPQVSIHLDQIFFTNSLFLRTLYPYMGYGFRLKLHPKGLLNDQGALLARAPFGLEFGNHLRAFIELSPSLSILPKLSFYLHSALGLRYHF